MVKNYLLKYICTPIIAFITGMYISLTVYSVLGTITGATTPLYNMIPESLFLSILLYVYMGCRYSNIETLFIRTCSNIWYNHMYFCTHTSIVRIIILTIFYFFFIFFVVLPILKYLVSTKLISIISLNVSVIFRNKLLSIF